MPHMVGKELSFGDPCRHGDLLVDETGAVGKLLVKILRRTSMVTFTRPRRFGKSVTRDQQQQFSR